MNCERPYDIVAFLKGELAEDEVAPARAHVESCTACGREVEKLDRVLRALGKLPRVEPSPDFRLRVRAAFVAAHPEFLERPIRPRMSLWEALRVPFASVPGWSLSLAIHVLLLTLAAILFLSPDDPERAFERHSVRVIPRKVEVPLFGRDDVRAGTFVPDREHDAVSPPVRVNPRKRPLPAEALSDWRRAKFENPFARFVAVRTLEKGVLREQHGVAEFARSVDRALEWLVRVQSPEGAWRAAAFGGEAEYDVGVTGLALLALLADGHTPVSGRHAKCVERGIAWLMQQQKLPGLVGEESAHSMYNHGIAALALLECSMMTGDEAVGQAAQLAVAFTQQAQNEKGGWDYLSRGVETDTSVGGWQVQLLRLAREHGNDSVVANLILARERILELMDGRGRVGYRSRADDLESASMPNGPYALAAIGAFSYVMSSSAPESAVLEKFKQQLQEGLATHLNDLVFWHYGSLVAFQVGGAFWGEWRAALHDALAKAQLEDGSWPADFDRWSRFGGRVYTTAMAALVFETCHRYPRMMR